MATYTVEEIIRIARVSGYLTANDIATGALYGEKLDPDWNVRLYLERTAVEWMYRHAPTYSTLTATANYLFALCGGYGRRAAVILAAGGSGSVVSPISPASDSLATEGDFVYLIPIRGTDFSTTDLVDGKATKYNDARIVGEQVQVFWNEVNRYLESSEYTYTPTGIQVLIDGFDALTSHAGSTFKIYLVHPDLPAGTTTVTDGSGASTSGTSIAYEGDATYALGANTVLDYMIVFPGSNATLKIGTTLGGEEVLPEQDVLTTGTLISPRRYSIGGETLYLTGLPTGSRITYFTTTPNLS
jgi:hypothetical protein